MTQSFLSFKSVNFYYPSSISPVLELVSLDLHAGWTGVSGRNGAGKSTFLQLASGLLSPGSGSIIIPGPALYCAQRTDELPPAWEDFFYADDNRAGYIMDRLGIGHDWPWRWETLSHGERKRLQLALALWQDPALLAVDEPTNHLDREAKALIRNALSEYSGIGLLVSHDLGLMDALCSRCIFIRTPSLILRPGGLSQGIAEEKREMLEAQRIRGKLLDERERLQGEAFRRRMLAESAGKRLSKKGLDPSDSDGRGKINRARLTNKDAVGANLFHRMETRLGQLDKKISSAAVQTEGPRGIRIDGTESRRDRFFQLEKGSIELGDGKILHHPDLAMVPGDLLALTGPNGSGKSTLVRRIMQILPGTIPCLYIPQEISMEEGRIILARFMGYDGKSRGDIMSRFARLGSDPENLLQSALPSPGEIRKLLIAEGVFKNPAILIMDEPTNHLDLPSLLLLEETLHESRASLLLVSHDELFLEKLTEKNWHITCSGKDCFLETAEPDRIGF